MGGITPRPCDLLGQQVEACCSLTASLAVTSHPDSLGSLQQAVAAAPSLVGNSTSRLGTQLWLNSEPSRYSAEPVARPPAPLAPATTAAASAARLFSRLGMRAVSILGGTNHPRP